MTTILEQISQITISIQKLSSILHT